MTEATVEVISNIAIPVRDRTVLRADVYRPAQPGIYPTVLVRTPYGKEAVDPPRPYLRFARAGYVVVVQDCRGCFASEGVFRPFVNEADDGYDTVEWIAAQPWSNGKVGMYGPYYLGVTQWLCASASPPHLTTIVPAFTASDYHDGMVYQAGAFMVAFALAWALPFALWEVQRKDWPGDRKQVVSGQILDLIEDMPRTVAHLPIGQLDVLESNDLVPYLREWIAHPADDEYWAQWKIENFYDRIDIPVLSHGGWYDIHVGGPLRSFLGMRERAATELAQRNQHIVIGPWVHGKPQYGDNPDPQLGFGPFATGAATDVEGQALRWFDHWLKGIQNGIAEEKAIKYFNLGSNRWLEADQWPPVGVSITDYFVHSRGAANTRHGDGVLDDQPPTDELPDSFIYDPRRPVPSAGGGSFAGGGARDQRKIEDRPDVLVYTSAPLAEDLQVTGPITVTLWAESTAPDTDFTAKLVDVRPDGFAISIADNVIRGRYRNGLGQSQPLTPGEAYEFKIDLYATSNLFKKGHRIRVEISSSNFPRFDANPNTGHAFGHDAIQQVAMQTIHHDESHPTRISLPVLAG